MESTLRRVVTKGGNQHEDDGVIEPVSPIGQYLNSKVIDINILTIMESEVIIDVSHSLSQLREVFLPKNHRLSSIMTVNDILGGIIFLGVRRYMRATDTKSGNSESTAIVILNTRNVQGYLSTDQMNKTQNKIWGNQFGFLHIMIPELNDDVCSDPVDFVYDARKQIASFKTSPSIYLTAQCLEIIRKCRGHEAAAEFMHRTVNNASLMITNMIGPIERITLADHPIKGMYFVSGGVPQSLLVTIMSYMQTVRIGLSVEKDFIDSQRLESCIKKAFEHIYEAATKTEYPNKGVE